MKLTLVALFWGGTFVAGRLVAESTTPLLAATSRFLIAALILWMVHIRMVGRLPKLTLNQFVSTALLGVSGVFFYNIFFFSALSEMPASRTAIFVAFNPIITALLVLLFLKERFPLQKWVGLLIALIGALIVITEGNLESLLIEGQAVLAKGEIYMLSAVFSWAVYTVLGQRILADLSPLTATTYAAIWGTLLLMLFVWVQSPTLEWASLKVGSVLSILYLAVFGTVVAFVWFYQGVRHIGSAKSAVFTNLVPVFGVLLSIVLLNEDISSSLVVGGLLAVGGVALTNASNRVRHKY